MALRAAREVRHFQFKLSRYITYKMDLRVLLASFSFSVVTFVVYDLYFDILAPGITNGSVRLSYGVFFLVPIVLLIAGQTLLVTWLLHIAMASVAPMKKDALKAYSVTSVEVFLFSVYYLFFPSYGPYMFVTYFTPANAFGTIALPLLIVWTTVIIAAIYMILGRVFGLENQSNFGRVRRLLLAATMLAILMVMAD